MTDSYENIMTDSVGAAKQDIEWIPLSVTLVEYPKGNYTVFGMQFVHGGQPITTPMTSNLSLSFFIVSPSLILSHISLRWLISSSVKMLDQLCLIL